MGARGESFGARWGLAAGVAAVALMLVLVMFRAPDVAEPRRSTPPLSSPPPVLLQPADGKDAAFDETKSLFDPTPLFLPTRWNAAPRNVARPEPGATFENYRPKLSSASTNDELKFSLPPPVKVPATPLEALLADSPAPLFLGVGRADRPLPALPSRGAFVTIIAEATGQRVLSQTLVDAKPPGEGMWQPMEFLVAVDAAGLVGPLVVARRSDVEGVDNYFQRYLAQTLRVGQRLAPGFYRICVGP